jgi:hypothetical protein
LQALLASKAPMEVTALVVAWKEIDAREEAAEVLNGKSYLDKYKCLYVFIHICAYMYIYLYI